MKGLIQQTRLLWAIVTITPLLAYLAHASFFSHWLIDDSGITFAYARNAIHGFGLVAQPHTPPVEGYSNPLWTLLLAPAFLKPPIDPTPVVKGISFLCVAMTFMTIAATCRRLFSVERQSLLATFLTLGLLSTITSFVMWTGSGLENPLYALLVASYAWSTLAALESTKDEFKYSRIAGFTIAALALTRPDGILFILAFPLAHLIAAGQKGNSGLDDRHTTVVIKMAVPPIVLHEIFRLAYFGDILPNTFQAKMGTRIERVPVLAAAWNWFGMLPLSSKLWFGLPVFVTIALGLFWVAGRWSKVIARRLSSSKTDAEMNYPSPRFADTQLVRQRMLRLVPLWVCSLVIVLILPRDWMGEYRFATPLILTSSILLSALVIHWIASTHTSPTRRFGFYLAVVSTLLGLALLISIPRTKRLSAGAPVPFRIVAEREGMFFNAVAEFLQTRDTSYYVSDLGGTLYFSKLRIIDAAGLCDRSVARLLAKDDAALLAEHVLERRPTFIHTGGWFAVKTRFDRNPRFREMYEPISENVSAYALNLGLSEVYDGYYVLREAITDRQRFDALQGMIADGVFPPKDYVKKVPFPRDHPQVPHAD